MGRVDFLGIGAQKAGTSWLYTQLKNHPDIWLPPRKELHYFDRDLSYPSPSFLATDTFFERINGHEAHNLDFKRKLESELKEALRSKPSHVVAWYVRYFFGTYDDDWYRSLFPDENGKMRGEITPAYSFLKIDDIQRVYALNPDMKLILILRNPIDRALSQMHFYMRLGKLNTHMTAKEMIAFCSSADQRLRGDYTNIIRSWGGVFPAEQLHICFYDTLSRNPHKFLEDVCSFLGVSLRHNTTDTLHLRVNASRRRDVPEEVVAYLKEMYRPHLHELSEMIKSDIVREWI